MLFCPQPAAGGRKLDFRKCLSNIFGGRRGLWPLRNPWGYPKRKAALDKGLLPTAPWGPSTSRRLCALRAVDQAKHKQAAQRKKSAAIPGALFFGGHSERQFHAGHQKICCIGMAIATKTTGFLLLSRCPFLYLPLFSAFSASLPFSRELPRCTGQLGSQATSLSPQHRPQTTVSRGDQQGELASVGSPVDEVEVLLV